MASNLLKSLTFIGSTCFILTGCNDGPYADYSDTELQDAHHKCETADSMSPGAAITCDNIRRECKRRADEKGRTICF